MACSVLCKKVNGKPLKVLIKGVEVVAHYFGSRATNSLDIIKGDMKEFYPVLHGEVVSVHGQKHINEESRSMKR